MSNYNSLKATIDANIKQNGNQEITGQILNSVLNQMVTTLGAGYQFAGVAVSDTDPGTPDAKVFYIANGKGTYTKFGGINVTEDDVVVLYWDTSWHKVSTGIASKEELSELEGVIKGFPISHNFDFSDKTRPAITNSGNIFSSTSYCRSALIPIAIGDTIKFNIYLNSNLALIAFTTDDVNFVVKVPNNNITSSQDVEWVSDSDGYVVVCSNINFCPTSYTIVKKGITKEISLLKEDVTEIEKEIGEVKSNEEEIENFIGFNPYNLNFPVSGEDGKRNEKLYNFDCKQGKTYVIYHKTEGTKWTHSVYLQNVHDFAAASRLQTIEFLGSKDYTTTEFTCNVEGGTKYIRIQAFSDGNGGQVDFFILEKDSIIDKVEKLRNVEEEIDNVRKGLYGSDIFDVNKKQYFKNLFIQSNWASRNGGTTPHISPLVILWFSDIHGSAYNYNRLIEFRAYFNNYIQASICTGDLVSSFYGDDFSYFTANDIMLVIGNHDVQDRPTGEHTHTGLDAYNAYFKDKISNWGVIQPENAETEGLCYYYKDFTDRGIRLIVLDKMAWNATQNTWLHSVLTDAKNKNLAVICANHYPASNTNLNRKCSFCSLYTDNIGGMPTDAINSIQSFIDNEHGEFICHLTGHTHADYYGIIDGTTQISITIDCAYNVDSWNDSDRVDGEKSSDCFNIISIDTYDKTIKMFRVGVDRDRWLRHKGTLCVNYMTRDIIYND